MTDEFDDFQLLGFSGRVWCVVSVVQIRCFISSYTVGQVFLCFLATDTSTELFLAGVQPAHRLSFLLSS